MNSELKKYLKEKTFVLDMRIFNVPDGNKLNVGDTIALSKIPELIKKDPNKLYERIYICKSKNLYEPSFEFLETLYKNNPYIDGFIEIPFSGVLYDFFYNSHFGTGLFKDKNIIDLFSYFIGINPDIEQNNYYPSLKLETQNISHLNDKIILDLSCNNQSNLMNSIKIHNWFLNSNVIPDYQLKLNFINKDHYAVNKRINEHFIPDVPILDINSQQEYYDVLSSSNHTYCSFSGNSILLTALEKKFTSFVFPDENMNEVTQSQKRMMFPKVGNYITIN